MSEAEKTPMKYSWPASIVALALSGLLTWFVHVPLVYVMATIVCREIFPWFVWYEQYLYLAGRIMGEAIWLPIPFLFIITFYLVRRLLGCFVGSWRKPAKPAWYKKIIPAIVILAAVASAVVSAPMFLINAVYFVRTGPGFERGLQREKCSVCHSPYRPYHFIKAPESWRVTVTRMRNLEGAEVSEQEAEKIIGYLQRKLSFSDAWLFRAKCLRCHNQKQITATARTAEEWELIVQRMSRVSPYAFRNEWSRQLNRHTAANLAVEPPPADSPEGTAKQNKILFERKCGACHELGLALTSEATGEDAVALVERMAAKAPAVIAQNHVAPLAETLATLLRERGSLITLFPHDKKIEVAW